MKAAPNGDPLSPVLPRQGGLSTKLLLLGVVAWLIVVTRQFREARRPAYVAQCLLRHGMTLPTASPGTLTAAPPPPEGPVSEQPDAEPKTEKGPETTTDAKTPDVIPLASPEEVVVRYRRWPGRVGACAVVLVALFAIAVAAWDISGGSLLTMDTPSMCPSICVGALVADQPAHGPVHVGELISFHPLPNSDEIYTHVVVKIFPGGAIQTRGLANAKPDPWLITQKQVTGRVIFSVWELGWVFKIAPFLVVGIALWALSWLFISRRSRRALTRLWLAALVVIPLWMLRPLVRGEMVSSNRYGAHHGWLQEKLLNTGIMPVSFRAVGGQTASHVASTAARLVAGPTNHYGLLTIYESVSLYWWGWLIVVLVCLSPLLAYLWHVVRDDEVGPVRPRKEMPASSVA